MIHIMYVMKYLSIYYRFTLLYLYLHVNFSPPAPHFMETASSYAAESNFAVHHKMYKCRCMFYLSNGS